MHIKHILLSVSLIMHEELHHGFFYVSIFPPLHFSLLRDLHGKETAGAKKAAK